MKTSLNRREFLKLGSLALGGLALPAWAGAQDAPPGLPGFLPDFPYPEEVDQGTLVRVATYAGVSLYAEARDTAAIIGQRLRDQIVHVYSELIPPDAPVYYNRLWYRVWGGYLHSAHLQKVKIRLNEPVLSVPEHGMLGEITVPYTTAYQKDYQKGWKAWRGSRLYYTSTHWATGVETGPDGDPWYKITSELSSTEVYYIPARHLRFFGREELTPISPDVPAHKKRIEVSLGEQTLRAYEYDKVVYTARVSSGIPNNRLGPTELPTATPRGTFWIYSKMPSKHMGSVAGGPEVEANSGFSLPGVPWTCFFKSPGGYALHGAYWHDNFGLQMSHGCVNLRVADAQWIFRWSTPIYPDEITSQADWERTGHGTEVKIF